MFINALNSMIALFGCMLVGFICVRKKVFKQEMNLVFNKLLLNITIPAMFISAMNVEMSKELVRQGITSIVFGFVYHFICLLIGFVTLKVLKVKGKLKTIWIFALTFSNISFLGFPLIEDVFGSEMLFHATLFNISFNILAFSLGVYLLTFGAGEKVSVKNIVVQPAFIGVIIGMIIFVLPGTLPIAVDKMVSMFGAITPPLSMFVVGATLASTSVVKALLKIEIYIFSFIKLFIVPTVIYFVGNILIDDQELVLAFMMLAATPSAVLTVILAKRYNGNELLASEVVFVTTALSVITLPLMLQIFS